MLDSWGLNPCFSVAILCIIIYYIIRPLLTFVPVAAFEAGRELGRTLVDVPILCTCITRPLLTIFLSRGFGGGQIESWGYNSSRVVAIIHLYYTSPPYLVSAAALDFRGGQRVGDRTPDVDIYLNLYYMYVPPYFVSLAA